MRDDFDKEIEQIRQLEGEPVPSSLRDRLMADALASAGMRAYRGHHGWTLKRLTLAAGFTFALLMVSVSSLGYAFAGAL